MESRRKNKLLSKLTSKTVEGNKPGQSVEEYISKRFSNGDTNLHNDLRTSSHENDIKDILDIGFPVNVANNLGQSPLHYALKFKICKCLGPIVKLLVERGANVQMCDRWGQNVIFYALENTTCPPSIIEYLVDKGASIKILDNYGFSLLHHGLLKDRTLDVIKVLLDKGVDVHAVNDYGVVALHVAARFKRKDVIKELMKVPNIKIDVKDIEGGYTPLHRAITSTKSDAGTVQLLLETGANIHLKSKKQEEPLHLAAYDCNPKMFKVLLKHGASINALDKYDRTPLYIAVKECVEYNKDAIKILLDAGAKVLYPKDAEITPLHLAIDLYDREHSKDNLQRLQLLLKYTFLKWPTMNIERFDLTNHMFDVLLPFVERCQQELRSVRVKAGSKVHLVTLPKFIFRSRLQNNKNRPIKGIIDLLDSNVCPVYWEVVVGLLTRKELKDEIHKLMVYAEKMQKRATLNCYCLSMLLNHLSDEDLLNLLLAFRNSAKSVAPVNFSTSNGDTDQPCKRARIDYVNVDLMQAYANSSH